MFESLRPAHVVATGATVLAGNVWLLGLATGGEQGTSMLFGAPALLTVAALAVQRLGDRVTGAEVASQAG